MKNKSVFTFNSYKSFMGYMLTGEGQRGQLTRVAEALQCQRSYLSRVITEKLHITPDHAFNLARYWKLDSSERTYFQTLVEYDRSSDTNYRNHLKSQLSELKSKHESIQERTQRTTLSVDALQASYFSSWIWSAIHFLTSIPKYQTIKALSDQLGLKEGSLHFYLTQLETQGFIENKKDRWIYKTGEFHAPKNSPLTIMHHQNWRNRALIDAQNFENKNIHFTGVHTLSESDFEKLKEMVLNFIAEANHISGPSQPEIAVALTCDLFEI